MLDDGRVRQGLVADGSDARGVNKAMSNAWFETQGLVNLARPVLDSYNINGNRRIR